MLGRFAPLFLAFGPADQVVGAQPARSLYRFLMSSSPNFTKGLSSVTPGTVFKASIHTEFLALFFEPRFRAASRYSRAGFAVRSRFRRQNLRYRPFLDVNQRQFLHRG